MPFLLRRWFPAELGCYADANLYANESLDRTLGRNGRRDCFVNKRDFKLASYFFPAASQARALVVLVHGHGCSLVHEFLLHQVSPECACMNALEEFGIIFRSTSSADQ